LTARRATEGSRASSEEGAEGAGAADAPPAVVKARTAAAEKLSKPDARDRVRVIVVLSERKIAPGERARIDVKNLSRGSQVSK
jgi:hypothetical protein